MHFQALFVSMLLLALTSCTRDGLDGDGTGKATGKVVMVSLKVSVPPVVEPNSVNGSSGVRALSRNGKDADSPFTVVLEQKPEQHAATTRASDGTTKLYNLWLFQFNEDGSINGSPYKLSDTEVAVNDMVTIDVPLVVAENQTLYLLALGAKLNDDMSGVTSLGSLEDRSFEYLTNAGGHTESLITTDAEIPFAGKVSGVTVVNIDEGKRGLVEYNKPAGFVGGIEIRRLMARITLRYKFDVENYKLQGLKLLNVNNTIRLTNPDTNTGADAYATLEMDKLGEPDPNGFYSATWYVAQNRQGTVASILSEDQRYYKVVNGTASGNAPALGTQIEAWAYSTADASAYAIYQMYIGKNNIDNFDVDPNHFYNLRTTINAEINSAKNDERIRAYTATQYVEFHGSKFLGDQNEKDHTSNENYDLDAAYDVRPIVVQTQGQKVEVGIYADEDCTQLLLPQASWLHLSSSSNYTEAYNNIKEPLDTYITASTILPTQMKFYLYNKEYIFDEEGKLPDPGEDCAGGKRSLYIKATTTTNGDGGTNSVSYIFRLDQRAAIYGGHFGGERDNDGNYKMGLVYDRMSPRASSYPYLTSMKVGGMRTGYARVETAKLGYGTDNMDNGKIATRHLAENTFGQIWTDSQVPVPIPQKNASGQVLLYQYQYPASTFSARACYDKNRDENGNGVIDEEELKWYLPASNQLLGLCAGSLMEVHATSATENKASTGYLSFKATTGGKGVVNADRTTGYSRCVRDIPLPDSAPY